MNKFKICTGILLVLSASCAEAAPPQSVTDGQTSGGDAIRALSGMITNTQANTITQSNSTTGADTSTVQDLQAQFAISNGGNSGLSTQGTTQLDKCKNYVPNQTKLNKTPPDPVELARYQECSAVNELAQQPLQNAIIKSGLTKSDSLFQNPDNMYNYGNTNAGTVAGTALEQVGSGVGSSGGGTCVTTTEVTPATYATGSCTRSDLPNTQACQVLVAPTISTVPYCSIGGGTIAIRPWPSWPWGAYATAGGTDVWSADLTNQSSVDTIAWYGSFHGTIVYRCRAPSDPLYALGGIAEYIQNPNWQTSGGGLNFARPVVSVNFSIGLTSRVSSGSIINYNGWEVASYSMYYDGPTDQFYVSYNDPYQIFGPLVSCAPGYSLAWVPSYTITTINPVTKKKTVTTHAPVSYCTKATDASSVPHPLPKTLVATVGGYAAVPLNYYSCTYNSRQETYSCSLKAPYWTPDSLAGGGSGNDMYCNSPNSCKIYTLGTCESGFWQHPTMMCYPSPYDIPLTVITNDRAKRLYAPAYGHYTGSAGIKKVMDENITDSCAALQSQTSNPTATPAIAINGVLTCPAGKTLNGSYCN